ncbi:WAP Kazal immunoglobulin Kunitz and NTR domain-containing protein 2-like [Drosophila madeirensis]|uniref:WAP Kazal immunoglobulin Kunitz and NTR domain-containing protein 2-like n=1 Tax=Drosophila madeirensis TaxID=30013 RepID=A0AAU9FD92_DROMD
MQVALFGTFMAVASVVSSRMMQNYSAKCQSDPTLTGTCTNYTKMWFYSRSYGECIMSHFGGCGQTKNLFDSEEHCESLCLGLGDYKV